MKHKLLQFGIGALVFSPLSALAVSQQCSGLTAVAGANACNDTDLSAKLTTIINTLFIVVGAITVLIMIMGGIRYITSTGDSKRVQAAKDTILYAIIGLIVVILARAIVGFVIGKIA